MSIIIQNKKCFDNDIVCSKSVFISVGDTELYFSDPVDVQVSSIFLFFETDL